MPNSASEDLRSRPLPADWTVRDALDSYLTENGFTWADYDAKWTPASFMKIRFKVPNPPRHRWLIMRHDLHHIATGYGTNTAGEGEQAAWEIRRGVRPLGLYVGSIVISGCIAGMIVAPRRTLRAWRASASGQGSLFAADDDFDDLLALTMGELRERLAIPREGLAAHPRKCHSLAPQN